MGTSHTQIYSEVASTIREKTGYSGTLKLGLAFITLLFVVFFLGRLNLYLKFNDEVAQLFVNSKDISSKKYRARQLEGLPEPVRQYFRHVLKDGQPYASNVYLRHNGVFKTDLKKGWINISGEEYFTADKPGFVWKGKTAMFTARDMYIADQGRLVVSLFSLFTIENQHGEKYDKGELMRWLGESVCFPTNLLPCENLKWLPINDNSAVLEYEHRNLVVSFVVRFNDEHEIVEMRALRNMGDGPRQPWVTKLSRYQNWNGVLIPTVLEAGWEIRGLYQPYARFTIQDIAHNVKF
jgi:hypothetical protein